MEKGYWEKVNAIDKTELNDSIWILKVTYFKGNLIAQYNVEIWPLYSLGPRLCDTHQ